jgi:hypothetical protein
MNKDLDKPEANIVTIINEALGEITINIEPEDENSSLSLAMNSSIRVKPKTGKSFNPNFSIGINPNEMQ